MFVFLNAGVKTNVENFLKQKNKEKRGLKTTKDLHVALDSNIPTYPDWDQMWARVSWVVDTPGFASKASRLSLLVQFMMIDNFCVPFFRNVNKINKLYISPFFKGTDSIVSLFSDYGALQG